MSFSSSAKEDLAKIRLKSDSIRLAQLAGLVHTCGALTIGRGRGAAFSTETLAVGKLIVSLADALYSLETTIELSERERRRPLTLVTLLTVFVRSVSLPTDISLIDRLFSILSVIMVMVLIDQCMYAVHVPDPAFLDQLPHEALFLLCHCYFLHYLLFYLAISVYTIWAALSRQ